MEDEPVGIEVGEAGAELVEFFGGAVDFELLQLGKLGGAFEEIADVLEVLGGSSGSDVGFAAMDEFLADSEVVVEAGRF